MIQNIKIKNQFKIWGWEIVRRELSFSKNPHESSSFCYVLQGVSNQYELGRPITSSRIIRVDFESGVVETMNSFYLVQSGLFVRGESK